MDEVKKILQYKEKIERGGKKVRTIAEQIHQDAVSEDQCKKLALDLFAHEEPAVKMVAVFLFGMLASRTNNALSFLYGKVSQEQDWRVQEILAQAFDRYCSDVGYESALPTIRECCSPVTSPHASKAGASPFHKEAFLFHRALRLWL